MSFCVCRFQSWVDWGARYTAPILPMPCGPTISLEVPAARDILSNNFTSPSWVTPAGSLRRENGPRTYQIT